MIQELRLEGNRKSYDEMPCIGLEISDEDIQMLCKNMREIAIKNSKTDEEKMAVKELGVQQLISWGILIESGDKLYPTNAYDILTGNECLPNTIQCGVFKGSTKAIFVDRKEYSGEAWKIIEEAYQYVLRNIHMGATFSGVHRVDVYEISPFAIRELIVNAVVHRSYLDRASIQVAIYDDRLEILSPGKLPKNQTLERMQEGHSKIRNEALAKAFSYMKLMEHWGSGIIRVIHEVEEGGLPRPDFIDGEIDVIVKIYRGEDRPISKNIINIDEKSKSAEEVPKKCRRNL